MSATTRTFPGTFLVPGVSLNKRLYTRDMIAKAVARMRERIADPDGLPIVMRTHHGAGDNSRLIVGRVVDARQEEDGRGTYRARWYDTAPARDIAALVQPADGGEPGLRSVSIFGYFLGPERTVEVDGESVTTADDLEVDAIDFTATPGVVGALVSAEPGPPAESAARHGRTPICETWEVFVQGMTEQLPEPAVGDVPPGTHPAAQDPPPADREPAAQGEAYTAAQKQDMADQGQAMVNDDGSISYPIKTKGDLRKAIRAVGRGGADHDKIRAHIVDRAKALGLTSMIPDNWNADGSLKRESAPHTRFGEVRECYDCGPDGRAGFAIDAYNGPLSITLRAPSVDPAGLRAAATAAMAAACAALAALDPDMDADIDVPGDPGDDSDADVVEPQDADPEPGSGCPCGCGCSVPHDMAGGPGCPCPCGDCEVCHSTGPAGAEENTAPVPAPPSSPTPPAPAESATTEQESAVSETALPAAEAAVPPTPAAAPTAPVTAPAAPVAPTLSMTQEMLDTLLASAARAAVAAVSAAAPAAETAAPTAAPVPAPAPAPTAPAVQEQAPQAPALTAESVAAAVNSALRAQLPNILTAYGLPPRRGFRTTEQDQAEKDLSPEQLWDNRADLLLGAFGK